MKKKVKLEEIAGKVVENFALSYSSQVLLISFKDETFIVVGLEREAYEGTPFINNTELDVYDFLEEDLIDNSIYSSKELANTKEGIQNRNETLAEIAERETYARLKAKYDVV